MKTSPFLIIAVLAACLLAGCTPPSSTLQRPDGSPVPYPGFETNVVPWVHTNSAAGVSP